MIRALSDEDLAILGLESDTVAGHTCKVLVFGDRVDADRLRDSIAARLDQAPELSMRLAEVDGAMCWNPTEVDLSQHVVADEAEGAVDEAGLRARVARAFERRLDRSIPLWRLDVVSPLADGGSALIWTIHHALADGSTVMRLGREALWTVANGASPAVGRPRSHAEAQAGAHRRTEELL